MGTCAFALQEVAKPEPKETKSAAIGHTLRLGDPDDNPATSLEIPVKATKGTAAVRPPSMKKFWLRKEEASFSQDVDTCKSDESRDYYGSVNRTTDYLALKDWEKLEETAEQTKKPIPEVYRESKIEKVLQTVEKESLTRSYRYGSTWIDAEGEFEKVNAPPGIDICAFFPASNVGSTYVVEAH